MVQSGVYRLSCRGRGG